MLGKRVAYSTNFADIIAMRAICEEHEVFVYEPTPSTHVSIAGIDQGYYLEVPATNLEAAQQALTGTSYEKFLIQEA